MENLELVGKTNKKVPLLVTVFAWFLLIPGVILFLVSLFGLLSGVTTGKVFILAIALIYLFSAIGLRYMKRWALLLITINSIYLIFNFINAGHLQDPVTPATASLTIQLIVNAYLLTLYKKFD